MRENHSSEAHKFRVSDGIWEFITSLDSLLSHESSPHSHNLFHQHSLHNYPFIYTQVFRSYIPTKILYASIISSMHVTHALNKQLSAAPCYFKPQIQIFYSANCDNNLKLCTTKKFYVLRQKTVKKKTERQQVFPECNTVFNLLVNVILICYCLSETREVCHSSKNLLGLFISHQ